MVTTAATNPRVSLCLTSPSLSAWQLHCGPQSGELRCFETVGQVTHLMAEKKVTGNKTLVRSKRLHVFTVQVTNSWAAGSHRCVSQHRVRRGKVWGNERETTSRPREQDWQESEKKDVWWEPWNQDSGQWAQPCKQTCPFLAIHHNSFCFAVTHLSSRLAPPLCFSPSCLVVSKPGFSPLPITSFHVLSPSTLKPLPPLHPLALQFLPFLSVFFLPSPSLSLSLCLRTTVSFIIVSVSFILRLFICFHPSTGCLQSSVYARSVCSSSSKHSHLIILQRRALLLPWPPPFAV